MDYRRSHINSPYSSESSYTSGRNPNQSYNPSEDPRYYSAPRGTLSIRERQYTPKTENRRYQATLYFGGYCEPNSLIGGCAWSLSDSTNKRVAHGSYSVMQNFSSQTRLEYEGLLNGLQAALMKDMLYIKIRGSCSLAILQYSQDTTIPYISAVYYSMRDLDQAICNALPQFRYYEMELIPDNLNTFVFKLSKGAIQTYYEKREAKFVKQLTS